jgi:pyruvate dehydrogenase complex dehydrogenase (E1) component
VVVATLHALMLDERVKPETVAKAIETYGLSPDIVDPREA